MEVEEGLERGTDEAFPPEDPHLQKKGVGGDVLKVESSVRKLT